MRNTPSREVLHEIPDALQVHGVLVSVIGVGVLLLGESGMGKSECALDLVTRGYQLIADDVVDLSVSKMGLVGRAPDLTRGILEVRGLGLIDVRELFGEQAFQPESAVQLCIEFRDMPEVERIGTTFEELTLAGVAIPKFNLPVRPGRNLAVLVETAARLYLIRETHGNAERSVLEKHSAILAGLQ